MLHPKMPSDVFPSPLEGLLTEDLFESCCENLESAAIQDRQCDGNKWKRLSDQLELYSQDEEGDTVLHTAIILQDMQLVMAVISKAPSNKWLSFRNKLLQTPLHLAVLTNQESVVCNLIESGADVQSRDRSGNTPLAIACRDGMTDMVKCIITHIHSKDKASCAPHQLPKVLAMANYDGHNSLHLAANHGSLDIVTILIESGAGCNVPEVKTGRTILHSACVNDNIELVRYLTQLRTCNINAKTYDGLTPFDLARARSNDTICMVLAAAGARYGYDETEEMEST